MKSPYNPINFVQFIPIFVHDLQNIPFILMWTAATLILCLDQNHMSDFCHRI